MKQIGITYGIETYNELIKLKDFLEENKVTIHGDSMSAPEGEFGDHFLIYRGEKKEYGWLRYNQLPGDLRDPNSRWEITIPQETQLEKLIKEFSKEKFAG